MTTTEPIRFRIFCFLACQTLSLASVSPIKKIGHPTAVLSARLPLLPKGPFMATLRRTWLKHVSLGAGALLLRPLLEQLHAADDGKRGKPWRVVIVMQSNGFQPWAAQPKDLPVKEGGPAKTVDLSLDDYVLPDDLEPLKDYKRLVTVIQRLQGAKMRPSHSAMFGAQRKYMTGAREVFGLGFFTYKMLNCFGAVVCRHFISRLGAA